MSSATQIRSSLERSLPRKAYVDDAFFQSERENLFYKEWFLVGREEALKEPGDYLLFDVAGESIIVVRNKEGGLSAHYNVCRHRGSRLSQCDPKSTLVNSDKLACTDKFKGVIACPYHAWNYDYDGSVLNAPWLGEEDNFYKEEFPLYPVGVDTWGGFIFLNLSPQEAQEKGHTLMKQLGPMTERVKRYPLKDLRVAKRLVYEVGANWKVLAENYNECYHCGGVHPELCKIVPAFKQKGGNELDWDNGVPQAEGTFTFTFDGRTDRKPFPGLSPEEEIRHKGELIYPNMLMSLSAEHVAVFMLLPQAPGRTTVVVDFLFHPDEINKSTFNPMDAVDFWDLINKQDWGICESVQKGMNSRVFDYGFYAPMEDQSLDMRRYLGERIPELKKD